MPEQRSRTNFAAAIVVPTKNRSDRILRLVEALDALDGPPVEVVVVDDGSADRTSDRVHALATVLSVPVRVLRNSASEGPARARNQGWRATDAPIVIFTDDDCVPGPKWALALVEALERDELDVVAGVTAIPEDQVDSISMFSHQMVDDGEGGHYSTSNVAYRRTVLETIDGFDEGFQYRGANVRDSAVRGINGEDTDLAWRAIEAGFRAGFTPDAVVYHDVSPQPWCQYARNMRRLEGIVLLYKKHPQLRELFGKRWLFRNQDASALAVMAGLLGLGVRRLRPLVAVGILGATWHVYVYRRYRPPPERGGYLVGIPLALAADAYAVSVMIRSSIRYRTFLL